jgi:predicted NBD/HSP70 family sugar kinase
MNKRMVPGTPNLLRMVNRNSILFHLEQMSQTSRAELSQLTGLSPPTVSTVIRELIDEGWACELGDSASQGGKPRQMIQLNPNARRIIGVQLNQKKVSIRMTNLAGDVLREVEYEPSAKAAEVVAKEAVEGIKVLLSTTDTLRDVEILGLGVAVPGVVDDKGRVSNAPEFGWDSEPLREMMNQSIDLPVFIENDVKLAALGDGWMRKCHSGTLVYVHLDRGIGAGILIDGSLYRGAHFSAGEISNLIVSAETVPTKTSSRVTGDTALGRFEENYGLAALNHALSANDCGDATTEILRHLSFGVSNIIALLDPHTIVFGGEMTRRIPDFLSRFSEEVTRYTSVIPKFTLSLLGSDAPVFGAIRAVIDGHKSQVTWTSV